MGWLSFLSRRSTAGDLKAQAYDQTVAANPPIRGTYPVAGNGASILEKFQRTYPHLKEAHFNNVPLPPPVVPQLLERPSTAPTHRSPEESARPKSQSANSVKPLPPPPKKRHGPYKLPSKIANESNDDIANNKSICSVPSPTFTRRRNSSIFSGDSSSTRRFVDLLDAQSCIKPADFYGRVKATGTKDYDEDVADRNIHENKPNVDSEHTPEFYSKNSTLSSQSNAGEIDRSLSSRKRHSIGSELRTKPTSSHSHSTLPKKESSRDCQEIEVKGETRYTRKGHRRKSLHSYIPPSSADPSAGRPRSASIGKGPKKTECDSFPESLRERARAAAFEGFERDFTASLGSETKPIQPSRKPREIPVDEQDSDSEFSHQERNSFKHALPARMDQYKPAKNSHWRNTMLNASSITVKPPFKKESLQAFQSPDSGERVSESRLLGVEGSLRMKKGRGSSRHHFETHLNFHDSFYDLSLQPLEPPKLNLTHSRPNSRDELNHRDRNRSIISLSGKSINRSEVADVVPERGSSIRRWSLTSETAGSTLSSNPFRPQSGHTTNTSVDLAPRVPLPKTVESGSASFLSGDNRLEHEIQPEVDTQESSYSAVDPELLAGPLVKSSQHQPSIDLVIDEDASSVDSFDAPERSASEFEKDLLFQGYGFEGSQLPGLPGLFDAAMPRTESILSHRTQSVSAFKSPFHVTAFSSNFDDVLSPASGSKYSSRSLPYASRSRSSRLRMPTFSPSDSEEDINSELESESEEELNFDIPKTRSAGSRYHSYSSRQQYETATRPSMQDDLEFSDMVKVARLRREQKAKQRASSVSLRKAKGKEKMPAICVPGLGLDDPSNYADAES
ncbi:hypothetical protein M434DRAFT_395629 [Hypoxylon sp. CO27-5]|nr:hypothetical protein M434DRAFT_395629 [Hypoxylon sp. CO27-5]